MRRGLLALLARRPRTRNPLKSRHERMHFACEPRQSSLRPGQAASRCVCAFQLESSSANFWARGGGGRSHRMTRFSRARSALQAGQCDSSNLLGSPRRISPGSRCSFCFSPHATRTSRALLPLPRAAKSPHRCGHRVFLDSPVESALDSVPTISELLRLVAL